MAEQTEAQQIKLTQHFRQSPDYRTIFATGIYGGQTINGYLCMNLITDIPPTPITTESVPENNKLKQIKADFDGKVAIREVQCAVMMDIGTAKLTIEWLTNHVKSLESKMSIKANKQ